MKQTESGDGPDRPATQRVFVFATIIMVCGIFGLLLTTVLPKDTLSRMKAVLGASSRPAPLPAKPDPVQSAERLRILDTLQSQGLILKRTCDGNETIVDPKQWTALNADDRRRITRALALWCDDQHLANRMTIVEAQTGRRLAMAEGGEYVEY